MKILKILSFVLLLLVAAYTFSTKPKNEPVTAKQNDGMSIEEYLRRVDNKEKIVLVYFSADWCVPCVKLKPTIEQLATEEKDHAELINIDVDNNPKIALHFEINTLPLFYIYKKGKKVWENNTSMSKADLQKKIRMYE